MRSLMGSLTPRGRAFLSAGITALASSLILGLDDLARVAVLLLSMPVLAALLLRRFRHRLGLSRVVEPGTIAVGHPATVRLQLSSNGATVGGVMMLEEQVPYTLGGRPRFVLDPAAGRWSREVSYSVRPDLRGHYTVGPMTVRVSDPFGMAELRRSFTSHADLVATPQVEQLPPITMRGAWSGTGDNRPRAFAGGSAEDVTIREYRLGDDLRRVHWRSSARTGQLMVRREEQPWQSRATVFVDNRSTAHRGQGPASSFERAVSVAASVALHLAARGYRVRVVTADPAGPHGREWHEHGVATSEVNALLEALAVLELSGRAHLDAATLAAPHQGGITVAILGRCSTIDTAALSLLRHAADHALAMQLTVADWARPPATAGAATPAADQLDHTWLRANGWRAAALGGSSDLGEVWRSLSSTQGRLHPPAHDRPGVSTSPSEPA